eukprot:153629-Chlamydomonas_euryale.AAC.2
MRGVGCGCVKGARAEPRACFVILDEWVGLHHNLVRAQEPGRARMPVVLDEWVGLKCNPVRKAKGLSHVRAPRGLRWRAGLRGLEQMWEGWAVAVDVCIQYRSRPRTLAPHSTLTPAAESAPGPGRPHDAG